jgi:hypothetical protein
MQVKLSDETVVTFKPYYTHKADKVLWEEMNRDAKIVRDGEGNVTSKEIPAGNVSRAYEAVMQYIIESPDVTQKWLDDLPRDDYGLLYQAALDLYTETSSRKEQGKKS